MGESDSQGPGVGQLSESGLVAAPPIYCSKCGTQMPADAGYCSKCGSSLNPDPVLTPSSAPSLPPADHSLAWLVAFVPIFGLVLDVILMGSGIDIFTVTAIVIISLNTLLCGIDTRKLRKLGYDVRWTALFWAGLLVPVYLFKRARIVGGGYGYAVTWLICFFIAFFISIPIGMFDYFVNNSDEIQQSIQQEFGQELQKSEEEFKKSLEELSPDESGDDFDPADYSEPDDTDYSEPDDTDYDY